MLANGVPGIGDPCHLESDVAAVADDLGADLDELLPKCQQRPLRVDTVDKLLKRAISSANSPVLENRRCDKGLILLNSHFLHSPQYQGIPGRK